MPAHQARKRFGQNFLVDTHYVARIVDAIAPQAGRQPGRDRTRPGGAHRPLIERAGHLTAIEIDRDLAARLAAEFSARAPHAARRRRAGIRFRDAAAPALRVVGNLPYNISSPTLFHLARFASRLADIHVMLQREVVARMTALPATADYGRLTVMLQAPVRA